MLFNSPYALLVGLVFGLVWFTSLLRSLNYPLQTRDPPKGERLDITVEDLGTTRATDPAYHGIGRDGGGGGKVNGRHVVLFSDTLVRGVGPLTNTIVYSDPKDPTLLHEFGKDGVPRQAIPYLDEGTQALFGYVTLY